MLSKQCRVIMCWVVQSCCRHHTGSLSVVSEIGQEESLSVNDVDTIRSDLMDARQRGQALRTRVIKTSWYFDFTKSLLKWQTSTDYNIRIEKNATTCSYVRKRIDSIQSTNGFLWWFCLRVESASSLGPRKPSKDFPFYDNRQTQKITLNSSSRIRVPSSKAWMDDNRRKRMLADLFGTKEKEDGKLTSHLR